MANFFFRYSKGVGNDRAAVYARVCQLVLAAHQQRVHLGFSQIGRGKSRSRISRLLQRKQSILIITFRISNTNLFSFLSFFFFITKIIVRTQNIRLFLLVLFFARSIFDSFRESPTTKQFQIKYMNTIN